MLEDNGCRIFEVTSCGQKLIQALPCRQFITICKVTYFIINWKKKVKFGQIVIVLSKTESVVGNDLGTKLYLLGSF